MNQVSLTRLRLDEIGMASPLQLDVGTMSRSQNVSIRMKLVWSGQLTRSRQRGGVSPSGPAFSGQ